MSSRPVSMSQRFRLTLLPADLGSVPFVPYRPLTHVTISIRVDIITMFPAKGINHPSIYGKKRLESLIASKVPGKYGTSRVLRLDCDQSQCKIDVLSWLCLKRTPR